MAKTPKEAETENKAAEGSEDNAGLRVRRALMMKNLVPDQDWIMKNIVSQGKGFKRTVGRVIGVAHTVRRHVNDVNGKPVESIALGGIFEAETMDGEIISASTVYFPMAYAEIAAAALDAEGVKVVQVDVDIVLEATGKSIPYEWAVVSYVEGEAMAVLSALRRRRSLGKRPASLKGLSADEVKQIAKESGTIEGQAAAD